MDPIIPMALSQPTSTTQPMLQNQPILPLQPLGGFTFGAGVFSSDEDRDGYLSTLDSDTRDYVIKHTGEFRSRADIIECVNKLHNES
ncbi:MAG: hypothetical protein K0S01_3594 [Herbinix sp.]|jgi:hypothetical protein|nr:hypothetical protein [Herbinix sp.]